MMRRAVPFAPQCSLVAFAASPTYVSSYRFGGGAPTHHDHSGCFTRPLTMDEQSSMNSVLNRTVSGIVPGKMFMRHWIVTEQSSFSIVYRAVWFTVVLLVVGSTGLYSGAGINSQSWTQMATFLFLLSYIILHTHNRMLAPFALGAYTFGLIMW
eukprot:Tbor_TRINITY_DN5567_c1_g1::TRINITY_DN5567_c1_g1_i1::g.13330::m.13330